jgi:hypothetical protein
LAQPVITFLHLFDPFPADLFCTGDCGLILGLAAIIAATVDHEHPKGEKGRKPQKKHNPRLERDHGNKMQHAAPRGY